MQYRRPLALGLLAAAAACAAAGLSFAAQDDTPTAADNRVVVLGTLTCSLVGSPSDTARNVRCAFLPGDHGPEETYVGAVQGIGKTQLLFGKGTVMLAVKGPASTRLAPGLLTQRYSVDAAAGGNGMAPLAGERTKDIMLQPLAEEEGRVEKGKSQPDAVLISVDLELQASSA
jgi:hypothetical protein